MDNHEEEIPLRLNVGLDPDVALLLAESERDDVIRAAARLAGALKDIFNDIGEMPEVRARVDAVYSDISSYTGQEERGL